MAKQPLKYGEKVLFSIFGAFIAVAVISFVVLESVRMHTQKPMFKTLTHFTLSSEGKKGFNIYNKSGCSSCHKAMRSGTNMGLDLDGVGSRRSQQWLLNFLSHPEKTYNDVTFDHGAPPKEAAYVSQMPQEKLHAISVFLSELKADRGSADAPEPPKGDSSFINMMLKSFAPKSWKSEYTDIRKKDDQGGKQPAHDNPGK